MNTTINNLKEEVKVPFGIWTPDAKVLCYECHGNVFSKTKYNEKTNKFEDEILNDEEFAKANEAVELNERNAVTKCHKCNKDVQVLEETAYENNLYYELKNHNIKSYMSQTGGMNSALEIPLKDDKFALVTYNDNGEDDWYIGFYKEDGDFDDKSFCTLDKQELLDYILEIDNLE